MNDLITVYMPTYNRLNLLKRAVGSVLQQTYQNFELIIVDDNSTDGTKDYLKELEVKESKIRIHLKVHNSGPCASRNIALNMAEGKYFTGLDDDDYFHPKRLEILIKKYNPKYSLMAANWFTVRANKVSRNSFVSRTLFLNDLLWGNKVGNQAFMETDRVRIIGGFDEDLKSAQDADLWIRAVDKYGPAKRIRNALYYFDQSHEFGRITISKNKAIGLRQYLEKHKSKMNTKQIKRIEYSLNVLNIEKSAMDKKTVFQKIFFIINNYGVMQVLEAVRAKLKIS